MKTYTERETAVSACGPKQINKFQLLHRVHRLQNNFEIAQNGKTTTEKLSTWQANTKNFFK